MMRTLSSFVTGAAAILTVGLIGCVPDPGDPFDTLTTVNPTTVGDGDGDDGTTGDGDGDSGDGDGDSGDGDGDTSCPVGTFGCPCDAGMCEDGLTCQPDDTCGLGGDGDGDGDGDPGPGTWDPMMCAPPAQVLMVMDIEGSFCSSPCTMATQATDCPMGPPGTMPACALTMADPMVPEFCALICDPAMDACPAGSSCKEVPNQPGVGLCTYP